MSTRTGRGTTETSARDHLTSRRVGPKPGGRHRRDTDDPGAEQAAIAADRSGHRAMAFGRAVGIAVLVVAVQALLVALFAWPAIKTAPHDLPVVVAAPSAAAAAGERLNAARPGAFKVSTVADEPAAIAALRDRRAYAAFVTRPDGPALLVASAASPVVAQLLTQQAEALGDGDRVPVADVVPGSANDPRGAGFAAGLLPLILTSMGAGSCWPG